MRILSLIPKNLWGVILVGLLIFFGSSLIYSYRKGVEITNTSWELKMQTQINKEVSSRLTKINEELKEAIIRRDEKALIAQEQSDTLENVSKKAELLQEQLDEVLKQNPVGDCSTLPDDFIRMYESMYNKTPAS